MSSCFLPTSLLHGCSTIVFHAPYSVSLHLDRRHVHTVVERVDLLDYCAS